MKVRANYVSNSSSASFIIYNFDKLPVNTQEAIKEYDKHAYAYCREHELELDEIPSTPHDPQVAAGKVWGDFNAPDGVCVINDICRWHFRECGHNLVAETDMDNFNLENWLRILGIEDYSATGGDC